MKAIISTYDRTGIVALAKTLVDAGFELVSTGGTGAALREVGLAVTQVADLTGSPEILDGRVKTLHPKIHGGILARRDLASHTKELAEHGIDTIDLVAVNLYPFVKTVSAPDATLEDALENIDIGGPTMIRAAAKNFPSVIVLVDPSDYSWVSERLILGRGDPSAITHEERRTLARKAFQHVALYDIAADRIRPIEHDERDPVLSGGFHRVRHRGDVGVIPRSYVLHVEEQNVHAFEHLGRRAKRLTVEGMDRHSGALVDSAVDTRAGPC